GNPLSFSVLRTGTGDLDLLAGGNFSEKSPFGVYTAGTQSADVGLNGIDTFNRPRGIKGGSLFPTTIDFSYTNAVTAAYQAWYPEDGGDLLLSAQGNVSGYISPSGISSNAAYDPQWLWRQADADGTNAAWWINFGTYIIPNQFAAAPAL